MNHPVTSSRHHGWSWCLAPLAAGLATLAPLPGGAEVMEAYDADLVRAVLPRYPEEAAQQGIEGRVRIGFVIEPPGLATKVRILQAEPRDVFEQAILEALQFWRFRPAGVGQTSIVVVAESFPETVRGMGFMQYMETYSPVPSKIACSSVAQAAEQTFVFEISNREEPVRLEPLVIDPDSRWAHAVDSTGLFDAAAAALKKRYQHPFVNDLLPTRVLEPRYPGYLREIGEEGYVTLAFEVDENGKVRRLRRIEQFPPDSFEKEAHYAVRQWRYDPILVNGVAVRRSVCQTIEFRLEPPAPDEADATSSGTSSD